MIRVSGFRSRWLALLLFFCFLFYGIKRTWLSEQTLTWQKGIVRMPAPKSFPRPTLNPAIPKPASSDYTQTLVIARRRKENSEWARMIAEKNPFLSLAVYTVDHPSEPFVVPKNKGHEVMPYLTYIIDHYHNLSDITIFMHAHLIGWHNNILLEKASRDMVQQLSSAKVIRDGYFNMRCHHDPGCPHHGQTYSSGVTQAMPGSKLFGKSWKQLFPNTPVPKTLSAPCCSQFALSRERIQSVPLEQYEYFRKWVLATPLEDELSGRVFEHIWHYIWTNKEEHCPMEHICYCDGYGICFGGENEYALYMDMHSALEKWENTLRGLSPEEAARAGENSTEAKLLAEAKEKIEAMEKKMRRLMHDALERGKDENNRAEEVAESQRLYNN